MEDRTELVRALRCLRVENENKALKCGKIDNDFSDAVTSTFHVEIQCDREERE